MSGNSVRRITRWPPYASTPRPSPGWSHTTLPDATPAVPGCGQGSAARSGRSLRDHASQLEDAGFSLIPSTLSQWGSGHHLPRLDDNLRDRLFMLERLAWAPTGSQVQALLDTPGHQLVRPAPQRSGPRRPAGPPGQGAIVEASKVLLERLRLLFGPDPDALVHVASTEHHVLDHRQLPVRTEITVAAVTGAADRYWHVHATHTAQTPAPSTVQAGHVCTRGIAADNTHPVRVDSHTTHQLAATELLFDQPLAAGAEHTFSFTVHHSPDTSLSPDTGPDPHLDPRADAGTAGRVVDAGLHSGDAGPAGQHHLRPSSPTNAVEPRPLALRPSRGRTDAPTIPVDEDGSILVAFPAPGWYGYRWDRPTERRRDH